MAKITLQIVLLFALLTTFVFAAGVSGARKGGRTIRPHPEVTR